MSEHSKRYLSVWLRRLATDRIVRRLSAPAEPLVVAAQVKSAQRIVALNDAAAELGLTVGLSVADACARYPALAVMEADAQADAKLLEAIADWCDRYTPLVGLDPPDGLLLDITGCAHLFGGETAMARDLVVQLARQGFYARAAVADTVGCASAMARYGDAEALMTKPSLLVGEGSSLIEQKGWVRGYGPSSTPQSLTRPSLLISPRCPLPQGERALETSIECSDAVVVVPCGAVSAVTPLPIAALRLDPSIVADLATMGLKRIADLAARPRPPLAARFGDILLRRLDQALGLADEPISPRLPLPAALAEQRFAEPIGREADVLGTIEQLARQLSGVLERRGEGARLIGLALFRVDGQVHRLEIGTGAPLREPARVRRLFEDRLVALGDACDPGFGFDVVRLSALVTERIEPVQTGLAAPDHDEELAHLIDRLGARFGLRRVSRMVPQDTHIPEFAVMAVPAHAVACPGRSAARSDALQTRDPGFVERKQAGSRISGAPLRHSASKTRVNALMATRCTASGTREESFASHDSLSPARPLRLFARPEPIEAIAEVPDGPPVRFRWRHVMHQVARVEGPERIAMEWWRNDRDDKLTRDYFRVESKTGARVWLYREGLYGRETERPRWYLHGLFA